MTEIKFRGALLAEKSSISLKVNGELHELQIGTGAGRVDPADTLSFTLRENLGLTRIRSAHREGLGSTN